MFEKQKETVKDFLKLTGLLILLLTFVGFAIGVPGAFVSADTAVKALEVQGFTDVKITHHAWILIPMRGGAGKDMARFTCIATNPVGKKVEVYVFVGWPFKGATVRNP